MTNATRGTGGRAFAYAGVATGLGVSIWANVAHAMTPPAPLPHDWPLGRPWAAEGGALAMAAFWPLALFLALEVLTRTSWQGTRGLVVARGGVGLVAVVAAVVSYLHLHGLLLHYGEGTIPALLGPLAIDGLMAVSAAALLTSGRPMPRSVPHVPMPEPAPPGHVPQGMPRAHALPGACPAEASEASKAAPMSSGLPGAMPAPEAVPEARRKTGRPGNAQGTTPSVEAVIEALDEGTLTALSRNPLKSHFGLKSNSTADRLIRATRERQEQLQTSSR